MPFVFLFLFISFILLELIIWIIFFVINTIPGVRNFLEISQEARLTIVTVSMSEILPQKQHLLPINFLLLFDVLKSLDVGSVFPDLDFFELVQSVHGIYFGDNPSTNLIKTDFSGEIFGLV